MGNIEAPARPHPPAKRDDVTCFPAVQRLIILGDDGGLDTLQRYGVVDMQGKWIPSQRTTVVVALNSGTTTLSDHVGEQARVTGGDIIVLDPHVASGSGSLKAQPDGKHNLILQPSKTMMSTVQIGGWFIEPISSSSSTNAEDNLYRFEVNGLEVACLHNALTMKRHVVHPGVAPFVEIVDDTELNLFLLSF